jgi:hypothetical protein
MSSAERTEMRTQLLNKLRTANSKNKQRIHYRALLANALGVELTESELFHFNRVQKSMVATAKHLGVL